MNQLISKESLLNMIDNIRFWISLNVSDKIHFEGLGQKSFRVEFQTKIGNGKSINVKIEVTEIESS